MCHIVTIINLFQARKIMSERKYSQDHEWVEIDNDGNATVGISDFAQKELGDVVYIELPELEREVTQDEEVAVIESVKTASDVKIPISGTIIEVNEVLNDSPELINSAAETDGWIIKMTPTDPTQLDDLMDAADYADFTSK